MTKLHVRWTTWATLALGFCSAMLAVQIAAGANAVACRQAAGWRRRCSSSNARPATPPTRPIPSGRDRRCSRSSAATPARPTASQYSAGFAKADFVWDDAKLDAWLTNPQELIPGAVMAYRQAKPETRAMIIAYLKELN